METVPATKRALLDAATEVFTEKGLHGARIIDVTRRAGVAAGTFYTYFESKEELFAASVAVTRERSAVDLPRARFTDASGARAWLDDVARIHVERLVKGAAIWRMVNEAALGNVDVAQALSSQADPLAAALSSEFRLWAEHGWISPGLDADVVAQALMALAEQCVQHWCADPAAPDLADSISVVATAWTSILRMPPEGDTP